MSEEAKTEEVTGATATAEKPQGATVAPAEGSAPQGVNGAEGEPTKPNAEKGTKDEPQTKTPNQAKEGAAQDDIPRTPKDFIKLRKRAQEAEGKAKEAATAYETRIKALEERFEKLSSPAHQPKEAASEDLSFLDNPDAWLESKLTQRLHAVEQQTRLDRAADDAGNWLSTRGHIKQDGAFANEVKAMLAPGGRYYELSNQDPMTAAEAAYHSVCRSKGISPDWNGAIADSSGSGVARATVPVKGAPLSQGPKVYTRQEVSAMMNGLTPGSPEFMKRADEIDRAAREGRIKA